jgi:hypothetical protein
MVSATSMPVVPVGPEPAKMGILSIDLNFILGRTYDFFIAVNITLGLMN